MTMPNKIWASEVKAGYGEWQDTQDGLPMPLPYIRADIVEKLVDAAEKAAKNYYSHPSSYIEGMGDMDDAITAYREASK